MPFHAAFLALTVPPVAAVLALSLFGAAPIGMRLIASVLPPAYALGAAPAFLGGRLDRRLARKGWTIAARLTTAALLALAAGLALLAPFYLTGRIGGAPPLLLPVAFALSALLALGLSVLVAQLPSMMHRPERGARDDDG